jgi:hypothetical protein
MNESLPWRAAFNDTDCKEHKIQEPAFYRYLRTACSGQKKRLRKRSRDTSHIMNEI